MAVLLALLGDIINSGPGFLGVDLVAGILPRERDCGELLLHPLRVMKVET
jgi:hypothetical protein